MNNEYQYKLTQSHVASVWWCVAWRSAALATAFNFASAVVLLLICIAIDATSAFQAGVFTISYILMSFLGGFVAVGMALKKQYKGFRLAVVGPREYD